MLGKQTAGTQDISCHRVVSTDPPYYDNIGYADLSDFFYVWLRCSMKTCVPSDLFAYDGGSQGRGAGGDAFPPWRGRTRQEVFFLDGMTEALRRLSEQTHPGFPGHHLLRLQAIRDEGGGTGTASTGWETFLDAVIRSGFAITRHVADAVPRTRPAAARHGQQRASLPASSSSVAAVPADAPARHAPRVSDCHSASDLPRALRLLQTGNVAPVDLAQAAIGPGMAVYTRYAKVLDAAGKPGVGARGASVDQRDPR